MINKMKSRMKLFGIIAFVSTIGFLVTGCLTKKINTSLEGVWDRGDIVVTITGNEGVFTKINPDTNWHKIQSKDLVKIGDVKFKNITKTENLKWTAQELSHDINTLTISGWNNTVITMDPDGKTLHILTGGNVKNPNNSYKRVQ